MNSKVVFVFSYFAFIEILQILERVLKVNNRHQECSFFGYKNRYWNVA